MRVYRTFFYLIFIFSLTFNSDLVSISRLSDTEQVFHDKRIAEHLARSVGILKAQLLQDYAIHYLLPFTKASHIKPCHEVFPVEKNFREALSCANNTVFQKDPLKNVKIPTCYVITKDSPDVLTHEDGSFNYISTSILLMERILGFYEEKDETMYLVETFDIEDIFRHESYHYFLHLKEGDGNGAHDHEVWTTCSSPTYSPSPEAVANSLTRRL